MTEYRIVCDIEYTFKDKSKENQVNYGVPFGKHIYHDKRSAAEEIKLARLTDSGFDNKYNQSPYLHFITRRFNYRIQEREVSEWKDID